MRQLSVTAIAAAVMAPLIAPLMAPLMVTVTAGAEGPKPVAITYGQDVDVPMPAAFHVFAARPADWDGDGSIDLLAAPATGGAIYLLKNIGTPKAPRFDFPYAEPPLLGKARGRWTLFDFIDGQYGAQGQKPAVPQATNGSNELPIGRTFDVGDMDGDGDLDFLLARTNQVSWLRNTGSKAKAAWGAPEPIVDQQGKPITFDDVWATINPESVDWDGDGLKDLILGMWHPSRYGNGADIRILQPRHAYGRDGGHAYLLRNTGTNAQPRYVAPVALASNTGVIAGLGLALTRAVDWDGDGDLDLTVAFYDASIRYYENTGTRTSPRLIDRGFIEADGAPISSAIVFRPDQAFLDLDGDGDLDLIAAGHGLYVGWYENTGSRTSPRLAFRGGLPMRATATTPVHLGNIVTPSTFDVDGDGVFDLLSGNEAGLIVWSKNTGTAAKPVFAPVQPLPGTDGKPLEMFSKDLGMSMWGPLEDWDERTSPVAIDWDGDGLWDVVTSTMSGRLYWIRNAGTKQAPRFEKPRAIDGPSGPLVGTPRSRPGALDWNGDGVPDLIVPDERGVLTIFLGSRGKDGKGASRLTRTIVPVSPKGDALVMNPVLGNTTSGRLQHAVADWDGDGKLDILVSTRRDTTPRRYVIMWYRNIGTSDAPILDGRELLPSVDSGHEAGLHVVDWDQDGTLDVITGDQEGRVWFWDGRQLPR
jgi:hypothetical protein